MTLQMLFKVCHCTAPCSVWAGWVSSGQQGRKQRKGQEYNFFFFGGGLRAHLAVADLIEQRGFNALRVHKGRKSSLREEKKKLS